MVEFIGAPYVKTMRKLPVKLKDRYAALETFRRVAELNEFRRRKMAMRELLNHRLELERHRGYIDSQRVYALRHVGRRVGDLQNVIRKLEAGQY